MSTYVSENDTAAGSLCHLGRFRQGGRIVGSSIGSLGLQLIYVGLWSPLCLFSLCSGLFILCWGFVQRFYCHRRIVWIKFALFPDFIVIFHEYSVVDIDHLFDHCISFGLVKLLGQCLLVLIPEFDLAVMMLSLLDHKLGENSADLLHNRL